MSKGKYSSRGARRDILKTNAANQRRKTRQQNREQAAKQRQQARYDRAKYDGSEREES